VGTRWIEGGRAPECAAAVEGAHRGA
jgi:hypothetical protein